MQRIVCCECGSRTPATRSVKIWRKHSRLRQRQRPSKTLIVTEAPCSDCGGNATLLHNQVRWRPPNPLLRRPSPPLVPPRVPLSTPSPHITPPHRPHLQPFPPA